MPEPAAESRSGRILSTSHGSNRLAFTVADWTRFVAIGAIWGSSFLLIAEALDSFEPGLITWLRVAFGAGTLWLFRGAKRKLDPHDRPRIIALSFLWVAIPFTLFPLAQQHVTSALAGMLNGAVPIIAAAIAALMLRALPGRKQLLGLTLGFTGIVLITLPELGQGSSRLVGVAMILVADLCYGLAVVIAAPLQQRYGPLPVMARMLALAAIWTAPLGVASIPQSSFSASALGATLVLGVLGTGVAFVLMGGLVGRVGSTRAAFAIYLIPVFATILGVVVRNETVMLVAIVGVMLVIIGATLASRREQTERSPKREGVDA